MFKFTQFFFSVDSLNSYVQLLDLISQDATLKDFLLKNVRTSASCPKSEFTKDDLPQVIFQNVLFLP